jgi:hypothetical protein
MTLTGENRRSLRRTRISATVSAANPTWTDLGAIVDHCVEKPLTDSLDCGTALSDMLKEMTPSLKNQDGFL